MITEKQRVKIILKDWIKLIKTNPNNAFKMPDNLIDKIPENCDSFVLEILQENGIIKNQFNLWEKGAF